MLTRYPLENADRQLANTLIYGLLRNRESLDVMLQHLCAQSLKKIKPFIHQALRVGLYQIMFLDRIPESAAVNESVKAVQMARLPKKLQGFVNGVLRNSIRKRDELLNLLEIADPPVSNHPHWLVERWNKKYGQNESLRICRQNNERAALCLQVNTCVSKRQDLIKLFQEHAISSHIGQYNDDALILDDFNGVISTLPGFDQGYFQVQDQGAQLLAKLIGTMVPGANYLDACAGLGGKTSILIQLAHSVQAQVFAVEPDAMRQKKFRENMARLHPKMDMPLFTGTLQDYADSPNTRFHKILIDAPCSGTGVIRRHPDIRWNRRIEDFAKYQQTQMQLLQTATTLLQPNGSLIYCTCSIEREENEQVINSFLEKNSNFSLQECKIVLPDAAKSLCTGSFFSPLPNSEIDGFFGAVLTQKSHVNTA